MKLVEKTFKGHPCYENSSVDMVRLIITEGKDFDELLSTLPSDAGISTTDKCQSNPEECVQEIIRGSRSKRSWGDNLVVGLSSAFFTFVSNRDLNSKIDKLRDSVNANTASDLAWRRDSQTTFNELKKYAGITNEALRNETCRNQLRFSLTEYLFQIQSYYTRMRDLIVMALNNQVSRDLLSVKDMFNTLRAKPELRNTIYKSNPHLFYVLSNVFISHYNSNKSTLHLTLTVPPIESDDVSMMYKVYNYGWMQDEIRYRYSTPEEYFTIKDDTNSLVVEASKALCRTVGTLDLCDTGSYIHSHRSACMQNILENNTESNGCELLVSKIEIIDQVIPIRSGVLVYGRKTVEEGILIKGHPNIQSKKRQKDSDVIFYKYKSGHFLKIDNTYYKEKANAEDIHIVSSSPLYHKKKEIDFGMLGSEFVDDTMRHIKAKIEKMKEKSIEYYRSAYLPSPGKVDLITMAFIGLTCILALIVGALVHYIKISNKCKNLKDAKDYVGVAREAINLGELL